jgi:hypothetical protein
MTPRADFANTLATLSVQLVIAIIILYNDLAGSVPTAVCLVDGKSQRSSVKSVFYGKGE